MTTRKLQYKAVKDSASTHIGSPGDIFYDPAVAELRMYDGNPGGMTVGGGGGGGVDLTTVTSHILPSADLTYDLGSTSSQWRSLYVGTSTIYLGGTPVSVAGGSLTVGGTPVGGGSSGPIVVNRDTGGSDPLIIIPDVPTEIGQVYTYIFPNTISGSGVSVSIRPPVVSGASLVAVEGRIPVYTYATPCTLIGPDASTANSIKIFQPGSGFSPSEDFSAFVQFVYLGIDSPYAKYFVVNSQFMSSDVNSRIVTI